MQPHYRLTGRTVELIVEVATLIRTSQVVPQYLFAAGGALALLFIVIVTGNDPVADGPGGCVTVPSSQSP